MWKNDIKVRFGFDWASDNDECPAMKEAQYISHRVKQGVCRSTGTKRKLRRRRSRVIVNLNSILVITRTKKSKSVVQ